MTRNLETFLTQDGALLHLREEDGVSTLCHVRSAQGVQRGDKRATWPVYPLRADQGREG
jgi:hypothetical protein